MTFKGTPGPWRVCGDKRGGCFCGQVWSIPADFPVAMATLCADEAGEIPVEQMKANALLISAAPDLLEACMKLAEWDKNHTAGRLYPAHEAKALEAKLTEIVTAARAAISKSLNQEV